MSSLIAHCSVSYHNMDVDVLDVFAVGVRDGIFGNDPPFTTPPLTEAQFQVFIDNYVNTRGAYKQGGLAQKGPFQEAKNALMGSLDDLAAFVDSIANGNVNTITLAGYVPTKTGSTTHNAPAQPQNIKITRGAAGELFAECEVVPGADFYGCLMFAGFPIPINLGFNTAGQLVITKEVQMAMANAEPGPGDAEAVFDMTKSRKKKFMGLNPGVVYYFYFYAVNATGVSPLSEVRSLMCG